MIGERERGRLERRRESGSKGEREEERENRGKRR